MQLPIVFLIYFSQMFSNIVAFTKEVIPFYKETACNKSEFFQVETLKCVYCDVQKHLKPTNDKRSCTCDDNSRVANGDTTDFPRCIPCAIGEIPTLDKKFCISCTNITDTVANKSDSSIFTTPPCSGCSKNEILVEREIDGKHLGSRTCIECVEGTKPSPDQTLCIPCFNNSQCTCPSLTHEEINPELCVPKSIMSNWPDDPASYMVEFPYSNKKVTSRFLKHNLRKSLYLCKMKNRTACQILANMCVMVLYQDDQRSGPCRILRDAKHIPNLDKEPLPWLYYGEGDAPTVLARKKILTRYSLEESSPVSCSLYRRIIYDFFMQRFLVRTKCDLCFTEQTFTKTIFMKKIF